MNHHYQLIVIGSGSGGKDAAILGARAGLRVLLVEKDNLGGTCFHRGVYSIRTLRACAMHYQAAEKSSRFGLSVDLLETGWADWIATQRRVSTRLAEDLSRTLEGLGVQIRFGTAKLLNPNEVEISDPNGTRDRVSGQNIIIATGSRPAFSSVKDSKILNSDQMLKNTEIPQYLLIIGGAHQHQEAGFREINRCGRVEAGRAVFDGVEPVGRQGGAGGERHPIQLLG